MSETAEKNHPLWYYKVKNYNQASLTSDALTKLGTQMGYTALLVYAYSVGVKIIDMGIVAIALVLPSLLFTAGIGRILQGQTSKWFQRSLYLRGLAFVSMPFVCKDLVSISIYSAVIGFLQQAGNTSKLSMDAALVSDDVRTQFNSKKAFLSGLATIIGPSLAGFLVALNPKMIALPFAGLIHFIAPLFLKGFFITTKTQNQDHETKHSWKVVFGWLSRHPELALMCGIYATVLAILEMEAPLVFPFIRQTYQQGFDIAGSLLGVCGLGSLLGATLIHYRKKILSSIALALIVSLDGAVLFVGTLGVPLLFLFCMFSMLGIISSVTLITVETELQNKTPKHYLSYLFGFMSFVGGTGGACLTLLSTKFADQYGALSVLKSCSVFEICLGFSGAVLLFLYQRCSLEQQQSTS